MNFVIISSSFSEHECELLSLNLGRIRSVLSDFQITYVVNNISNFHRNYDADRVNFIVTQVNPDLSSCAAVNRLAGWRFTLEVIKPKNSNALIVFLDGDMVIERSYLKFLSDIEAAHSDMPTIISSSRIDLRFDSDRKTMSKSRTVSPRQDRNKIFKTLYGAFAIRNLDSRLMIMTHDHEEQWFLTMCKIAYRDRLQCIKFHNTGILHCDKWYGYTRLFRMISSSRGVGFWQGILSFKYGLIGVPQVIKDNTVFLGLFSYIVICGFINPWLIILPFLHPKSAKRLIWMSLGLIKLPFFKSALNVEYRSI